MKKLSNLLINFVTAFALVFMIVLVTLYPSISEAIEIRTENQITIPVEGAYNDNTYLAASRLEIFGTYEKDLTLVGGDVIFNGNVKGDLMILGGQIEIRGTVAGDVRILGGEVSNSGEVKGDLMILGGKVSLESDSKIEDEIILVGGDVKILSEIDKKIKVIAGFVSVDSKINSSIEVTTQKLELGNNANLSSELIYYSPTKIQDENLSKITGSIVYNQIPALNETGFVKRAVIHFISFWILLKFISLLIVALILTYVFRVFTQNVTDISIDSFGKSLLWGFLLILIFPVVITMLFLSLIGLPIGFIILLIFILLMIISTAVAGIVAGVLIKKIFNKGAPIKVDFQTVTLGIVVLTFVGFVPFIGDITRLVLDLVALGAIVIYASKNFSFKNRIQS